jgi:hypothetical protein
MEPAMFFKRAIIAMALFGALMLGWSSSTLAQNAQAELRADYRNDCQVSSGKERGACMRRTARTMRDLMEMALAAYKQCISEGYDKNECAEVRDRELRDSQVY